MAFCNSCGATLDAGTKFCNKCGTAVPAASAPAASTPAATTTPAQGGGGSNVLKIVLIVVAVLGGLGIIGAVTTTYIAHRAYVKFKENAHIEEKNGKVKVESP